MPHHPPDTPPHKRMKIKLDQYIYIYVYKGADALRDSCVYSTTQFATNALQSLDSVTCHRCTGQVSFLTLCFHMHSILKKVMVACGVCESSEL